MNPFIIKDYYGPQYFCDRLNETNRLINAIYNQRNLTLSSLRKMGKTGLIHHVFHQLDKTKEIDTFYFDIYHTSNLTGFINKFGTSILTEKESFPEEIKRMINQFILSIRPTVSYDSLSGSPTFSFNVDSEETGVRTIEDIFGFLSQRSKEKPMVIAIDEFQQIAKYPENNVEALLRTHIQKLPDVNFIFSGSDKQLLTSIFTDVKRPFYQSTELMHLDEIPESGYSEFIKTIFSAAKRNIDDEAIQRIFQITKTHTYYVQYLCNKLYSFDVHKISRESINQVLLTILRENEYFYSEYRDLITPQQWRLLIALAKEDGISKITSSAFMKKHNLSNNATVRRGVQSLLDKKIIYKKDMKYFVYDVFFAKWLERL